MWRRGNQHRGQLIEAQGDSGDWLVNIDGKLIVVKNDTGVEFKKNQYVLLEVKTERPLSFHILGRAQRRDRHINVRI